MSAAARTLLNGHDSTQAWSGFQFGVWQNEINVRDFIQQNYAPYDGDESFLAPATERTQSSLERAERIV